MPDLDFYIRGASAPPYSAAPQLHFELEAINTDESEAIHAVILSCQIQIESVKRSYTPDEKDKLRDLFGEPERWGQTLRNKLWTHAQVNLPAFTDRVTVALPVLCTYDLNVVATKYFYALDSGDVPLNFLFSGTVFYAGEDGCLQAAPISWNKEASFRLPIQTWQEMIACYFPNTNWLTLHQSVFDRLYDYKQSHGLPTWEQTIDQLLTDKD